MARSSGYRTARPQYPQVVGNLSHDEFKVFQHIFRFFLLILQGIRAKAIGNSERISLYSPAQPPAPGKRSAIMRRIFSASLTDFSSLSARPPSCLGRR